MTWALKDKVLEEIKLLTPNGEEILVGENEDEVLIAWKEIPNWEPRVKEEQEGWSLKPKVES